MNLFFMGLIYPDTEMPDIMERCKTGMQMQVDTFQKLILQGLNRNHNIDSIKVCNAIPVGSFPKHYKDIYLPNLQNDNIYDIGSLNLPFIKQKTREIKAFNMLKEWIESDKDNRNVLIYSLYLPYMKAAIHAKEIYKDLKLSIIVPDIPNSLGLASGRRGPMYFIEQYIANRSVWLCQYFDYFVLLTSAMKDELPIKPDADICIVEGIAPNEYPIPEKSKIDRYYDTLLIDRNKPCVVYTGTVQEELGIWELINAFDSDKLQNVNLILAGPGNMEQTLLTLGKRNIKYLGFIDREKALLLQAGADILINPRKPDNLYTKYSFPSKTMEYMLSCNPVLCYKLDGIPNEYDKYLHYIENSIEDSILNILNTDKNKLKQQALDARYFVLNEKNADARIKQIIDMWQHN